LEQVEQLHDEARPSYWTGTFLFMEIEDSTKNEGDRMTTMTFSIFIKASPKKIFTFVGDLLRHPEWATDQIKMEAISSGAIGVGSQYRSTATFKGFTSVDELQVVEYQPPTRLAFTVKDIAGRLQHQFVLHSQSDGTLVERSASVEEQSLLRKIYHKIMMPILMPFISC
jgi:Polyketide cyclase / dehydrase and lipid transport